jgi:pimeloyl-ACP methyl ester carboxylesterase
VTSPSDQVAAWEAQGSRVRSGDDEVFVLDAPATGDEHADPLLVLHGFPTCSFDWRHVLPRLREGRRVVLLDFPGFGLSSKPDRRYSLRTYADAVEAVARALELERVDLLTHDMGDSVGGELLARDLEGALPFAVVRRVLTNGSIYIELAHLTAGQQLLLSLDDARLDVDPSPTFDAGEGFRSGLGQTFSAEHPASEDELAAQWELLAREGGHALLPRTIRYIEDRRAEERRFTGAIEAHPSPLGVVWGVEDPVAVVAMVDQLVAARPDATVVRLDGVGHYPMVEAPDAFATAVLDLLA